MHPPVARKHPPHLPSRACRLPLRRRCRHNHHHFNASTTGATSPTLSPYNRRHPTLPHRQGVQKVLAPTISARPPFAHPPPLCRSSHSHGCPCCTPRFTRPTPSCRPPLHARGRRRDSAPLVPSARVMPHARGRAACKGKGRAQGEGEGPGGMRARGRAAYKGRRVCERASERGCARTEGGVHPFRTPCTQ